MPECSVHGKDRGMRFLERLEDGTYKCKVTEPCHSHQLVCAIHGKQRSLADLDPLEDGTYRCREGKLCNVDSVAVCDMCNGEIPEGITMEEHFLHSHKTLSDFCADLEAHAAEMAGAAVGRPALVGLGKDIRKHAQNSDKGPEEFKFVLHAHEQMNAALVRSSNTFRDCKVFMFGSCVALGCWDGVGDVDFTLVDPKGWEDRSWPTDEKKVMDKAASLLRDAGFRYDDLEVLKRTRVPIIKRKLEGPPQRWRLREQKDDCRTILFLFRGEVSQETMGRIEEQLSGGRWNRGTFSLRCQSTTEAVELVSHPSPLLLPHGVKLAQRKFKYPHCNPELFHLDFDLSARAFGIRNSFLLRAYNEQGHHVRVGGTFVKHWSKRAGVNNSMRGYLTSYAVSILWMYFLVVKGAAEFVDPVHIPYSPTETEMHITHMHLLPPKASATKDAEFDEKIAGLVVEFFRFYAFEFNWENNVASISKSGVTEKEDLEWALDNEQRKGMFRDRVWYRLCIEDPFELNLNLGRHVSPHKFQKVRGEFLYAFQNLLQGHVERVLRSRSHDAVSAICVTALRRAMVGKRERSFREVIAELRRTSFDALAAFEVESKTEKLVSTAGFKLQRMGDEPVVVCCDGALFVPQEALEEIRRIDAMWSQTVAHCGLKASHNMLDWNLHTLYVYDRDHGRLFASEADKHTFAVHASFVSESFHSHMVNVGNEMKVDLLVAKKGRCRVLFDYEVFDAVLHNDTVVAYDKERDMISQLGVIPMTRKGKERAEKRRQEEEAAAAAAAAATGSGGDIKRDANVEAIGKCDGCKTKGISIWPTTNPKADNGMYCDACWKAW